MNKIVTTLILLLLLRLVPSVNAQDQENPKGKLHRDFPNVQLIRPSIPPWHFNFDSNRWERDYELMPDALPDDPDELLDVLKQMAGTTGSPELAVPADHTMIDLRLIQGLSLPSKHKPKGRRHKKTHHHVHHTHSGR